MSALRNKLRLNNKIWNHIRVLPIQCYDSVQNMNEEELMDFADMIWTHLENDELTRHIVRVRNQKGLDKFMMSVWSDINYCYLVQSVRTEFNTDQSTVYICKKSDEQINDFISITKSLSRNIGAMLTENIKRAKEAHELMEEQKRIAEAKEIQKEFFPNDTRA